MTALGGAALWRRRAVGEGTAGAGACVCICAGVGACPNAGNAIAAHKTEKSTVRLVFFILIAADLTRIKALSLWAGNVSRHGWYVCETNLPSRNAAAFSQFTVGLRIRQGIAPILSPPLDATLASLPGI